jgi:hypothetical protein
VADPEEVIKPLRDAVRQLPVGAASNQALETVRQEADKANTALRRLNDAMRMILEE